MVLGFVIFMFFLNSFVPGVHLDLGESNFLLPYVDRFCICCHSLEGKISKFVPRNG